MYRPTKLVLAVRADLGMGKGKIAAQAAHAAVAAALRALGTARLEAWLRDGQPKVVLRVAGEEELLRLRAAAEAAGLPVEPIHDSGRTQVEPGTVTCCAIGPAFVEELDPVTGDLPLL